MCPYLTEARSSHLSLDIVVEAVNELEAGNYDRLTREPSNVKKVLIMGKGETVAGDAVVMEQIQTDKLHWGHKWIILAVLVMFVSCVCCVRAQILSTDVFICLSQIGSIKSISLHFTEIATFIMHLILSGMT